jgi:hypothetical protein
MSSRRRQTGSQNWDHLRYFLALKPIITNFLPLISACKSGQAAEHGVEQGAKARALIEAGENRAGLLLENSMTDFVGGTF